MLFDKIFSYTIPEIGKIRDGSDLKMEFIILSKRLDLKIVPVLYTEMFES